MKLAIFALIVSCVALAFSIANHRAVPRSEVTGIPRPSYEMRNRELKAACVKEGKYLVEFTDYWWCAEEMPNGLRPGMSIKFEETVESASPPKR